MLLYIHYYSHSWDTASRTFYKMILNDFKPRFVVMMMMMMMMMMRCDMMMGFVCVCDREKKEEREVKCINLRFSCLL